MMIAAKSLRKLLWKMKQTDTAKIKEILHAFKRISVLNGVEKKTWTFALNVIYIRILYHSGE